jgi:hypothetical protein
MSDQDDNLEISDEVREINRKLLLLSGSQAFDSPIGQSLIDQAYTDVNRLEVDTFYRLRKFKQTNG